VLMAHGRIRKLKIYVDVNVADKPNELHLVLAF
jgi:hypothetical protein